MFRRCEYNLVADPVCTVPVDTTPDDFRYYDKDGFELNIAEQKYYQASGYKLFNCLNHLCWQEDWLTLDHPQLSLDHCLILTRASYGGEALKQLKSLKSKIPNSTLLANTRQKWGFDFALDAVDCHGNVFEVIHIEYDSRDYSAFVSQLVSITHIIYNTDWVNAARRIEQNKDKWQNLRGFEQNHWKANFLIGWNKAEYTDKTT